MAGTAASRSIALDYLSGRRTGISLELERVAQERGQALESRLPGGTELMARVLEYARRGKMLRGALVHLGADLFAGGPAPKEAARPQAGANPAAAMPNPAAAMPSPAAAKSSLAAAAAAMEFFQAGLLIHDDIMDHDEMRRGAPSFHSRYERESEAEGATDPVHLGESLGICAGDVCFFEGFAALAAAVAPLGAGAAEILSLCSEELSAVGLAQMRDCRWGGLPLEPTEAEILAMYRGKTSRYSFSLPLATGALIARRPDARAALFEIGELAGLCFQLRDDELGLFGDEAVTGKSAMSDIREGKKTVYRARLLGRVGAADRARLAGIYGSSDAGEEEAAFLRGLLETLGIRKELEAWRADLAGRAKALVAALPATEEGARAVLADLVDWSVARSA
jgi:geranylgeranyl diphosphate synthase type I